MKEKIFTLIITLIAGFGLSATAQVNTGTGVPWGSEFFPSSNIVLNEDFQGFEFFHSDSTSDMGNSNNTYASDGTTIVYGYKNDTVEVPIIGSESRKITYTFQQCAFAPEWRPAYAFRDDGGQTPNVSNGFVEVSRDYASDPPTVLGFFDVDLSELEYVDGIQWTHSSCGGNKRGVLLLYSIDDGASWDTLRFQGSNGATGFTKDITTGTVTQNMYNCQPSAYGMTWEEGIYYEGSLKLRFSISDGQVPRIHDLIVYGDIPTSANITEIGDLKIYSGNRKIRISEPADVAVYSVSGNLVKKALNTNIVQMNEVPTGIYLVKANSRGKTAVTKVVIQ